MHRHSESPLSCETGQMGAGALEVATLDLGASGLDPLETSTTTTTEEVETTTEESTLATIMVGLVTLRTITADEAPGQTAITLLTTPEAVAETTHQQVVARAAAHRDNKTTVRTTTRRLLLPIASLNPLKHEEVASLERSSVGWRAALSSVVVNPFISRHICLKLKPSKTCWIMLLLLLYSRSICVCETSEEGLKL